MNNNKVLVGVLAVAVVVLGVVLTTLPKEKVAGPQGPKGEIGLQGPRGLTGPQGPQGLRGLQGLSDKLGATTESLVEYSCVVDFCEWTKTGRFADATTSLVSILNPFAATATAQLISLDIFGLSTSTVVLDMGTSTSRFGGVASTSRSILNNYQIATGTLVTVLSGMTTGALGATSGNSNTGIGTSTPVTVNPLGFVTLFGDTPAGGNNGGIIGTNNTFQGRYAVIFRRLVR